MIINVHAGHNPDGKIACGAVGFIKESTEARKVKERILALLKSRGHVVYDCTVDNGTSQSDVLSKIVAKCNAHKADLDVSIHFNAGASDKDSKTTGTEVLIYSASSKSASFAKQTVSSIAKLGFTNRGVKERPDLYVLKNTVAPAMLVECCFVDDKDDVALYDAEKMANAIVSGITGSTDTDDDDCHTPIAGKARATAEQMRAYIKSKNSKVAQSVLDMIPLYISEGEVEGIRGDIAFAQSCLETGNFTFKGSTVTLSQNNFCGLGVTSNGVKGNSFMTPQLGIRAQIQHLKAYANKEALVYKCVDPRFMYVVRGCAEYVEWLGICENPNHKGWASGENYGGKIVDILEHILKTVPLVAQTSGALYRVRNGDYDESSQKGAFSVLNNAKACADKYPGYFVFEEGVAIYPLPYYIIESDTFDYYTDSNGKVKAGSAKPATYTVTEVKEGYGKLKSGAGWIKLIGLKVCSVDRTDYLKMTAQWMPIVYDKIVELGCAHKSGATTYEEIISKKTTTCSTSVSAVLQKAGILPKGEKVSHTEKDGKSGSTKNSIAKAISGYQNLIKGTCDIVRINTTYAKMSSVYKKAGIVLVQDSNICMVAGDGSIYSTNEGTIQYKNGRYVKDKVTSGYPFTAVILYAIIPKT